MDPKNNTGLVLKSTRWDLTTENFSLKMGHMGLHRRHTWARDIIPRSHPTEHRKILKFDQTLLSLTLEIRIQFEILRARFPNISMSNSTSIIRIGCPSCSINCTECTSICEFFSTSSRIFVIEGASVLEFEEFRCE